MEITVTENEIQPAGTYLACIVSLVDLGLQDGAYGPREMLHIGFELQPDEDAPEGTEPRIISRRYGKSLNRKAALYKDVTAVLGKLEKNVPVKLDDLLGRTVMVTIAHNTRSDGGEERTFANIASVAAPVKGTPAYIPESDLLLYDQNRPDDEVYDLLPDFLQDLVDEGASNLKEASKPARKKARR